MRAIHILFSTLLLALLCQPLCAAVQESKADAYYNYLLGIAAEQEGDLDKAKAAFEEAASLDPRGVTPVKDLIEIALHQKRLEEAEHWIEEALKRTPGDIELQLLMARIAIRRREYAEAHKLLDELLNRLGDDQEVLFLLGNLYLKENRPEEAVEVLKKLARGHGRRALMARFFLGRLYTDQGRLDDAIKAYKELLQEDPHLSSIYKYLARIYRKQGKMKEAEKAYETLLVNDPGDAEALRELIELRIEEGSFDQHRDEFQRFLTLVNHYAKQGLRLVGLLGKKGMYQEALQVLQPLANAFTDPGPVAFYRALIREEMGETDKALELLKGVPEDSSFYYPAKIRQAILVKRLQGIEQAISLLRPLAAKQDCPKDLFLTLASLYRDSGANYKAYEVLQQARKRFPHDKELLMRLAMVMEELNLHQEGMEVARAVLEEDPDLSLIHI